MEGAFVKLGKAVSGILGIFRGEEDLKVDQKRSHKSFRNKLRLCQAVSTRFNFGNSVIVLSI
jgi:hypothetical protein